MNKIDQYKKHPEVTLNFLVQKADLMASDLIDIIKTHRANAEKIAAISVVFLAALLGGYINTLDLTYFAQIMILCTLLCLSYSIFSVIYYSFAARDSYLTGLHPSYARQSYFFESSSIELCEGSSLMIKAGYLAYYEDDILPRLQSNADYFANMLKKSISGLIAAIVFATLLVIPSLIILIIKPLF
ncbi:MAG: hypothetical protein AAF621_04455 [Pseudomonadota bacterium]